MNAFEKKIAAILEVESVQLTDSLAGFSSWDSLAILSTLALVDSEYGVTLDPLQLAKAETVGGIWNLVDATRRAREASS
jgi:acyl carrier protein